MTDSQATELTNSTEKEIFMPTPHMEKWIDTAIELMSDSPTEIANESRIDKSTWYIWIKNEAFRQWYKTEWDKRLAMVGPTLDAIGLKNAKRDHKYWQDMQKRVGNLQENKGSTVAVQVNNYEKAVKKADEFVVEVDNEEA